MYFTDTTKADRYQGGKPINLNGDGTKDQGAVVFNQDGRVVIKEPMTMIIIVRLSGTSTSNRLWIKLRNHKSRSVLAESIAYGDYCTGQITTTLKVEANTEITIETNEDVYMNDGGFISSMEIMRIK